MRDFDQVFWEYRTCGRKNSQKFSAAWKSLKFRPPGAITPCARRAAHPFTRAVAELSNWWKAGEEMRTPLSGTGA
jgi:hypothetical protein